MGIQWARKKVLFRINACIFVACLFLYVASLFTNYVGFYGAARSVGFQIGIDDRIVAIGISVYPEELPASGYFFHRRVRSIGRCKFSSPTLWNQLGFFYCTYSPVHFLPARAHAREEEFGFPLSLLILLSSIPLAIKVRYWLMNRETPGSGFEPLPGQGKEREQP
jgi:hypothetical protein